MAKLKKKNSLCFFLKNLLSLRNKTILIELLLICTKVLTNTNMFGHMAIWKISFISIRKRKISKQWCYYKIQFSTFHFISNWYFPRLNNNGGSAWRWHFSQSNLLQALFGRLIEKKTTQFPFDKWFLSRDFFVCISPLSKAIDVSCFFSQNVHWNHLQSFPSKINYVIGRACSDIEKKNIWKIFRAF